MTALPHWRILAGIAAILVLAVTSVLLPKWGSLRQQAVVEAARTFSLSSIEAGGYEWSVREGRHARGDGLMRERVQTFDRSDLVELVLEPDLTTGTFVNEGQVLATLKAPHLQRELDRLKAERDAVTAERSLLSAGARKEEVQAAQREVDVARAVRESEQAALERLRLLARDGAVSPQELQAAELQDRVRAMEIALAEAELAVARSSAQPEAIAALDGEIAALEAEIQHMEDLLADNVIKSPVSGTLEVGGNTVVLRVYDTHKVYLRVPVPETDRAFVENGIQTDFVTPSCPGVLFRGQVVDVGEDAAPLNGVGPQVFWASVEIANAEGQLRSGMSGVARLNTLRERSLWSWLTHAVVGY